MVTLCILLLSLGFLLFFIRHACAHFGKDVSMQRVPLLLPMLFALVCMPGLALAHGVSIFAWVDGAQVCTESYFTQSSKVRGGEVVMASMTGEILAQGITADSGVVCFPVPHKVQALQFSVLAGKGHKGTCTLTEKDLKGTTHANNATAAHPAATHTQQAEAGTHNTPATQAVIGSGHQHGHEHEQLPTTRLSEALIRQIVQEELEKQFSVIRQNLAEKLYDQSPGFKEIAGGIGWLLGLASLGFWFTQKRKQ